MREQAFIDQAEYAVVPVLGEQQLLDRAFRHDATSRIGDLFRARFDAEFGERGPLRLSALVPVTLWGCS
ncbi:hypothetical protein ACWCQW_42325 [Streptomyces mirabilis]